MQSQHERRDRLREEPEVPQQHDQERPVEGHRPRPQPLVAAIDQTAALLQLRLGVPEERAEEEDLQRHPPHHPDQVVRILQVVVLEERQRLLLSAGGGDAKRDRRAGPLEDAVDESQQEERDGAIRDDDSKDELEVRFGDAEVRDQEEDCNRERGQ